MSERRGSIIDDDRSACLCDVGAPDYLAAVCVTPAGDEVLWLVSKTALSQPRPDMGRADQPHETLGPLPHEYQERVRRCGFTCGRLTAKGRPCQARVTKAGDACGWHRDRQRQPRLPI